MFLGCVPLLSFPPDSGLHALISLCFAFVAARDTAWLPPLVVPTRRSRALSFFSIDWPTQFTCIGNSDILGVRNILRGSYICVATFGRETRLRCRPGRSESYLIILLRGEITARGA